jgi:uncharacterized protein
MPTEAELRMAVLHYPPTSPAFIRTPVTDLLEEFGVSLCIFGHVHNVRPDVVIHGTRDGVEYRHVAVDAIGFRPLCVREV